MEFSFIASGHEQLAASIDRPVGDQPQPAVIVIHGLTGQRLGRSYHLVEFARRLTADGIACVRFDQTGCGESTGAFQKLTIARMVQDTQAVRDWTVDQPWCDPARLGFVGLSLGALAAVAVEAGQPGAGMALWAPVFDMPRVFSATTKTGLRALLEHQGWAPYRGLRVGKDFVDQLDAVNPRRLLADSDSPILLFHSDVDEVVRIEESRSYQAACRATGRPCELVRFTSAGHDFADLEDRQKLLSRTVAFFKQVLS